MEHLNIAKNQFRRLPIQLSECVRLNELNVSDNEALVHIPERISNLPMLQSLAADREYKFGSWSAGDRYPYRETLTDFSRWQAVLSSICRPPSPSS